MKTHEIKNLLSRTVKKFDELGVLGDMERDEAFLVISMTNLIERLYPECSSERRPGGFVLIPLRFDRHVPSGALQLTGNEVPRSVVRLLSYHGIAVPKPLAVQAGFKSMPFIGCHCCELYLYSL